MQDEAGYSILARTLPVLTFALVVICEVDLFERIWAMHSLNVLKLSDLLFPALCIIPVSIAIGFRRMLNDYARKEAISRKMVDMIVAWGSMIIGLAYVQILTLVEAIQNH